MILPHPEKDLRLNLMVLGSEIIEFLNKKNNVGKYILIEDILSEFLKIDSRRTTDSFIYALVFLFSLGLIDHQGYKIKLTPVKAINQQNLLF